VNGWLQRIGARVVGATGYIGGVTSLFTFSMLEAFGHRRPGDRLIRQVLVKQIYFTGVQGFKTITPIALVIGMLTIVQMFVIAPRIGAEDLIGKVLIAIIVRELGPLLTAIIIIGRSGTAIATEIANMMVSDEFDALESIGIDPIRFIVYPRVAGMMISLTCLVIYFNVVGLLGGFLVARVIGISLPFETFFNTLFSAMSIMDLVVIVFKSLFMGAAIAVIAVMQGFKVGRNAMMVPVAATNSVVNSLLAVFLVDGLITLFSYI
jgi:phospholipid/cholesterol/gamma-HCH transport system permease protein